MKGLIGYTGFVGGNLLKQMDFQKKYNSKNIDNIKGEEFDVIICSGVSAVKWYANQNPVEDLKNINKLIENLKNIKAKKFILISTIDIYDNFNNIDEESIPNTLQQDIYGKNRYYLEKWVENNFEDYLIVRLPALFGEGLKKNFIYDLLNPIPSIIVEKKWRELEENLNSENFEYLKQGYLSEGNNYKFNNSFDKNIKEKIKLILENYGFTSLNFTDTRSSFPFYYLKNLSKDIEIALNNNIKILNVSVEPLTCEEVIKKILNLDLKNHLENKEPIHYDMKSKYDLLYNGKNGYLYSKEKTLEYLKEFINEELKKNEVSNF